MFISEMLRKTCFRIMITQMYLGFKFHCFGRSTKGVSNLLSNLFFDLSTRLFFEDVKICDFGQLWTVLLTLSDFIKYDLKRPVNGLWGHTFHSFTNWKLEDVVVFIFKTCYFHSSNCDYRSDFEKTHTIVKPKVVFIGNHSFFFVTWFH